jgi:hypothetical protein
MDNSPTISPTLIFPCKVPGGWASGMFTPITPNEIFDSRDRMRYLRTGNSKLRHYRRVRVCHEVFGLLEMWIFVHPPF